MALLKSDNLKLAIDFISDIHEGHVVTAIQFEDGSGYKFNYQLDGTAQWTFINLTKAFKLARANDTYFTTAARAIDYAMDTAELKGYTPALFMDINTSMFSLSPGQHWTIHSQLIKNNVIQSKQLHIILYRLDSGNYELTHYIN